MNKLVIVSIAATLALGTLSCSSTRKTRMADPNKEQNKAMRHRNEAIPNTAAGHQEEDIREGR